MAGRVKKFFGSAKPLPGQEGYKVKQSELLELEANAMERQLQKLRDQVQLEAERRKELGKTRGSDGSLWQSGSSKRGSLGRYSAQARNRQLQSTGHEPRRTVDDPCSHETASYSFPSASSISGVDPSSSALEWE